MTQELQCFFKPLISVCIFCRNLATRHRHKGTEGGGSEASVSYTVAAAGGMEESAVVVLYLGAAAR